MLLMSCQSTTIYKTVVPELTFPDFPVCDEIVQNDNETCTVPSYWIVLLSLYKIRIEQLEKTYNAIKHHFEVIEE